MFNLLQSLAEAFSGKPWTVYLEPFNFLILMVFIVPIVFLLVCTSYIWAKCLEMKEKKETLKTESKESKEAAQLFKEALERENSAFIHAERKRLYSELKNWEAELKADGINISWKWQIGSCRDIELKFDDSDKTLPCALQFAELGGYLQLVGATYIDDGREKKLPGTRLKDVPYSMYRAYYKVAIVNLLDVFSLLIEAAKTRDVTFDYSITLSQKREFVTENQFNAFLDVLGEEVRPVGLNVTGNFETLEVTLSRQ